MLSGIILAAGESRRMGRQKALLPYAGSTVIEHIVSQVLASGVDEVLVVLGHEAEAVQARLRGNAVRIVLNDRYRDGMLSSVRAGLAALPEGTRSAAIFLGDQPQVRADVVRRLIARYHDCGQPILVPRHRGRGGHPAIISMDFRAEILGQHDNVGLRGLFHAHAEKVYHEDVDDPGVLEDLDTPEDYRHALAQLGE